MRHERNFILFLCFTGIVCPQLLSQPVTLMVERQGEHLRLSAPELRFLEGKPLEQLHDGATVTYLFSVTLASGQGRAPLLRMQERYVVSFDLWEERFSVVQTGATGRSASHLTAPAAQAWCLENLRIRLPSLPPGKPFVIDLECAVVENENSGDTENGAGMTLAGLIDVFSRRERDALPRWRASSGPLRLADLKDMKGPKTSSRNMRKQ